MFTLLLSLIERLIPETDPASHLANCRKVLIVDPAFIGDMVRSTPAYRAVKEKIPGVRIEALIFEAGRPVFRHNPNADLVRILPQRSLAGQIATAFRLRRERYDAIINLYTGLRMNFLCWLIGAPLRAGYNYRHRGCFHNRRVPIATRTVQTTYRPEECLLLLERAFGWSIENRSMVFTVFDEDRVAAGAALARLGVGREIPVVGVHANSVSRREDKRWAPEKFAALADELIERYRAAVVFTGTAADAPTVEEILGFVRHRDRAFSAAGLFDLSRLGAFIDRCALFVSIDTGPLHMAIAIGTPTFAFVGGVHLGLVVPEGNPRFRGIASGYAGQSPFRPLREVPLREAADAIHAMAASLGLFAAAAAAKPGGPTAPTGRAASQDSHSHHR